MSRKGFTWLELIIVIAIIAIIAALAIPALIQAHRGHKAQLTAEATTETAAKNTSPKFALEKEENKEIEWGTKYFIFRDTTTNHRYLYVASPHGCTITLMSEKEPLKSQGQ